MRKFIWPASIITLVLAALFSLNVALAGGEPIPADPAKTTGYTFLTTQVISGTTINTAPSATSLGTDPAAVADWNTADVFVTTQLGPTATLTATVQFAGDGTNYANAYWNEFDSNDTVVAQPYRLVFTVDGTGYLRVPVAGAKMRLSLEATHQTTTSVSVVYRNN